MRTYPTRTTILSPDCPARFDLAITSSRRRRRLQACPRGDPPPIDAHTITPQDVSVLADEPDAVVPLGRRHPRPDRTGRHRHRRRATGSLRRGRHGPRGCGRRSADRALRRDRPRRHRREVGPTTGRPGSRRHRAAPRRTRTARSAGDPARRSDRPSLPAHRRGARDRDAAGRRLARGGGIVAPGAARRVRGAEHNHLRCGAALEPPAHGRTPALAGNAGARNPIRVVASTRPRRRVQGPPTTARCERCAGRVPRGARPRIGHRPVHRTAP